MAFSIFNTVVVKAPFVVMLAKFGQQSLLSGLEYLPVLVAFHMDVVIGVFGMIEVSVLLSGHMQQVFLF